MLKKLMQQKKKPGFTLIEILVVIVVIGLLFMFFVPRIGFAGDKAREAGIKADFRGYMNAAEQVLMENNGPKSSATDTGNAMNIYLDDNLSLNAGTSKGTHAFGGQYLLSQSGNTLYVTAKDKGGNEKYKLTMVYNNGSVSKATTGFAGETNISGPTPTP